MLILCAVTVLIGCEKDTKEKESTETAYKWSTDGGIKSCDHILFTNGQEDHEGKEIGDGDQEFVFTGKQTLKKGTYLLKGWVYIGNGAELTIAPGSVIKGDKITKAALIAERGGNSSPVEPLQSLLSLHRPSWPGAANPATGAESYCAERPNNQQEMQIEAAPAPSTVAI